MFEVNGYNPYQGELQNSNLGWGLTLVDLENNPNITKSLKTAVRSGNISLTSDQYKELELLGEQKFSGINYDGYVSKEINGSVLPSINMTGKDSGLYMTNEYLGFYNNLSNTWRAAITNTGEAYFGSITDSEYMHWNGTTLKVRGDIEARTLSSDAVITNTIRGGKTSYGDSTAGYWLGLDGTTPKFNLGNATNSLDWTGTKLNIKGNIEAATFKGSLLYDSITSPILEQGRTRCESTKNSSGVVIASQKVLHGYFGGLSNKQQISTNAMVLDEQLSFTNPSLTLEVFQEYILYHWFKPRFIECNISFRNNDNSIQGISIGKLNIINSEANFIWYKNSGTTIAGSSNGTNTPIGGDDFLSINRNIHVLVTSTDDYQTIVQLKLKGGFQIIGKFYLIG